MLLVTTNVTSFLLLDCNKCLALELEHTEPKPNQLCPVCSMPPSHIWFTNPCFALCIYSIFLWTHDKPLASFLEDISDNL